MLGGDIFSDFQINRANKIARQNAQVVDVLQDRLQEKDDATAANLVTRIAVEKQLRKLDPNHPLLVDKSLRERLQAAGKHSLSVTHDWDAVREVGNTFKIPGYD